MEIWTKYNREQSFLVSGPKKTQQLGEQFAKHLRGGEIVGLLGDLGGGKTTFVQGLARGLGVKDKVSSPTFVFFHLYPLLRRAKIRFFCHIDLYRTRNPREMQNLGFEEYWKRPDAVTAVEWIDRVRFRLPSSKIFIVRFEVTGPRERRITMTNSL